MKTGHVKWFHQYNGYGFIEVEGENDIFVHYTDIAHDGYKMLYEGNVVEFYIVAGMAREVRIIG